MTRNRDFLDELVHERTIRNPAFDAMVETAYESRVGLRASAEAREEHTGRETSGRTRPNQRRAT